MDNKSTQFYSIFFLESAAFLEFGRKTHQYDTKSYSHIW